MAARGHLTVVWSSNALTISSRALLRSAASSASCTARLGVITDASSVATHVLYELAGQLESPPGLPPVFLYDATINASIPQAFLSLGTLLPVGHEEAATLILDALGVDPEERSELLTAEVVPEEDDES